MQLHHPRAAPVQSLRHCFQPATGTAWEIVRVEERLQLGHAVRELSACLPGGAAREVVVEAVADVSNDRFVQVHIAQMQTSRMAIAINACCPNHRQATLWRVEG